MRIARTLVDGRPRIAVIEGGVARLAPEFDVTDALGAIASAGDAASWPVIELDEQNLLAPVAGAGKIIAVGLNYVDHTTETGFTQPERPLTFAKYATSITGPTADVVVPDHLTQGVDFEAELALLIGRLHGRQRRLRARCAVRRRAVDAGQVVRHLHPARAVARHAR